jgi:hypothetical protein
MSETEQTQPFTGWAICEMFGQRLLAGYLTEVEGFLRLDILGGGTAATQLYNPNAVYVITPPSEVTARRVAELSQPAPCALWELPAVAEPLPVPLDREGPS